MALLLSFWFYHAKYGGATIGTIIILVIINFII